MSSPATTCQATRPRKYKARRTHAARGAVPGGGAGLTRTPTQERTAQQSHARTRHTHHSSVPHSRVSHRSSAKALATQRTAPAQRTPHTTHGTDAHGQNRGEPHNTSQWWCVWACAPSASHSHQTPSRCCLCRPPTVLSYRPPCTAHQSLCSSTTTLRSSLEAAAQPLVYGMVAGASQSLVPTTLSCKRRAMHDSSPAPLHLLGGAPWQREAHAPPQLLEAMPSHRSLRMQALQRPASLCISGIAAAWLGAARAHAMVSSMKPAEQAASDPTSGCGRRAS